MAGWREKKREMLADVHEHFEIPAVYLTHVGGDPVAVTVRLHRKQIVERLTSGEFADSGAMLDIHDRVIFKKSQLPIVPEGVMSRAFVIFDTSECYVTGPSKPEREGYLWCEVSPTPPDELGDILDAIQADSEVYRAAFTAAFGDPLPDAWSEVFP